MPTLKTDVWMVSLMKEEQREPCARFSGNIPGIIDTGIYSGKCRDGILVGETCDISDLGHKLGAQGRASPLHRHDNRIFRKQGSSFVHQGMQLFDSL